MSKSCRVGHDIIKTGDEDARPYICDSNGEVVLSHCRKCGRGEVELEEPCVSLVWITPDGDKQIAYMARVSNPKAKADDPAARLIAFLLRNHHWSPFEMANMAIEVNTTRDITAQILRHKSASFQEFSTRYADVEELETWKECRFQDDKNRQNSWTVEQEKERIAAGARGELGIAENILADDVRWWEAMVEDTSATAQVRYLAARERGIAKEVARSILPIGLMPSKLFINGTIRTWIHYCMERTKPGVQKEHREIALAAEQLLQRNYPAVYEALVIVRAEEELKTRRAAQMIHLEHLLSPTSDMGDCLCDVIRDGLSMPAEMGELEGAAMAVIRYLRREMEQI